MANYPDPVIVDEFVQMMMEADDGKNWLPNNPWTERFLRDMCVYSTLKTTGRRSSWTRLPN